MKTKKRMETKYLVIGGGVTGLAFANFIESIDYLILEKEDKVGGYCKTIHQDGFTWDYSGHFFHFKQDWLKKMLMEKIDSKSIRILKKNTSIYLQNKLIPFPFQKNIHHLDKENFINCLKDFYLSSRSQNFVEENFDQMLRNRYGHYITDLFLSPYNSKLYATPTTKLSAESMGRFFPHVTFDDYMKSISTNSDTSYNSTFSYSVDGAEVYVKALLSGVKESKILLKQKVKSIDYTKKILVTDNLEISYDYIVNTSPLNNFIDNFDFFKFIDKKKFVSNKVIVLNLGFDTQSNDTTSHWIYFPEAKFPFYRVGFYSNIIESKRMSLYVECSFKSNDYPNLDELLEKVLFSLREIELITSQKLISYVVLQLYPAYVILFPEVEVAKSRIMEDLNSLDIYSIGRYGDWKYCSIEDSVLDAYKLANFFNAGLK